MARLEGVAAVVAHRRVAQQIDHIEHVAPRPGRKVGDHHRVGRHRRRAAVCVVEITRALEQRAVLLRRQHEPVRTRTARQRGAQHPIHPQRVLALPAVQARARKAVLEPVGVIVAAGIPAGHAQAVVTQPTQQRGRGLALTAPARAAHAQCVVVRTAIENIVLIQPLVAVGVQRVVAADLDRERVRTRAPAQARKAHRGRLQIVAPLPALERRARQQARVKRVVSRAATQRRLHRRRAVAGIAVIPVPPTHLQGVVAIATIEQVRTRKVLQRVVALPPIEAVIAPTALDEVVARATVNPVCPFAAIDRVIAAQPAERRADRDPGAILSEHGK